jgi:glutamyl-tRNA reductase
MMLRMVGCSHHRSPVAVRERLAFNGAQAVAALEDWRRQFPHTEAVLISTCNRVELYTAAREARHEPSYRGVAEFLADFHKLSIDQVLDSLCEQCGKDAVRHLFTVAASLDSMVLGEPQILSQVKQAYRLAQDQQSAGPITHHVFQTAVRVARRVATETGINQRRVSIPSVAIADFASQIFDHFGDKQIVVIGAGKMAEETLRYLREVGAGEITVINRSAERAGSLAARWRGRAQTWDQIYEACAAADLVISATGGQEPIMTHVQFKQHVMPHRYQRPLMILDLAIPRDFDARIGSCLNVYLYSLDDLARACDMNRRLRDEELPAALQIVEEETDRFMAEFYHRSTGPVIRRLREEWQEPKKQELDRLISRLPELDAKARSEIAHAFDRLVNKLLHPPLESLRDESRHGPPHGLLDALKRLFKLSD